MSSEREYLLSANRRELVKGLGVRYSDCRLSNFVFHGINTDRAKQQKVVERFKSYGEKFRENVEAGQNLVFFGKQGTGKDHLLTVAMFRAISEGYLVKWITGMDMYANVRDTFDGAGTEADRVSELAKTDILAISDPMPTEGDLSKFEKSFLYRVIDRRYRDMKPTWITANFFGSEDAEKKLSTQIVDRMKDGALSLYFDWPSYRKST